MTVAPHQGSFAPWWKLLSIEVYGATKPAAAASTSAAGTSASPITTGFDSEHHRVTALVPDDGNGLELKLAY